MKVSYLHSEIKTVECVEIIRDLRLGEFDVLVGINLLREGLDLPEVSLVAILDADKEGFLRSDRSLIQTIGRAARHVNGKAILYAGKITDSMKRAIDETDRRRNKQKLYNKKHNIIPESIKKGVTDIMEGAYFNKKGKSKKLFIAEEYEKYSAKTPEEAMKEIKKLEKQMYKHARNLEFEEAAKVRDKIEEINEVMFV